MEFIWEIFYFFSKIISSIGPRLKNNFLSLNVKLVKLGLHKVEKSGKNFFFLNKIRSFKRSQTKRKFFVFNFKDGQIEVENGRRGEKIFLFFKKKFEQLEIL
jgi:hypothetical protein